jgi:hypothetical protein
VSQRGPIQAGGEKRGIWGRGGRPGSRGSDTPTRLLLRLLHARARCHDNHAQTDGHGRTEDGKERRREGEKERRREGNEF